MMKRNNQLIIVVSVLAVLWSSCSDFLDQPIQGKQVLENYFANEDECLKALSGCYASLSPEDWWENDLFYLVGDICSDDAFKGNSLEGDQRDFGELARFNITPQNEWIQYKWQYAYEQIYRCNLVIKNVPEAPVSDDFKTRVVAEAKFLRAFAYFELVKNFGDVPLLLEPLTVNDPKQERVAASLIWEQIEKDLNDAALELSERSSQGAADIGRATKGAALAYLVKAYVYQEKWSEAETLAKQIVETGEYNLNDPFPTVWSIHNPNGNGSIFEIQTVFDNVLDAGTVLPVFTRSRADGGWGFATPSSHLDNFMAGDPRRDATIIKEGDYVDADYPSYDTQLSENETGRINRKYWVAWNDRPSQSEHTRTPLNHILFRYADLLLLHAEAAWHNGNEGEAISSVNMVRNRVGLGGLSSSGEQLLTDIYNERRMELALEGHRYYDLKRQKGIISPNSSRLKEVMDEFVSYNLGANSDYDAGNAKGSLFDEDVHLLFPIPQAEIDLSDGTITQNRGY
ncbi:RagB/SusD family nutrient uptake outer membrane protein [Carboxylicivirga sp. N1Y132]|uniref:RagB/SusD family nutrient uptake outer membrane protein n=2 Tax=Carboxylicivirga marina TaxID=2800988 RepID=A0ABS1HGV1_9BACT|nr:RagB/SusD family nutrient uptake outer membrane protein [uncultured Carboxylicivirga sp.]MBK3516869.1 RagB/SusD family nutrient uptake outer membrane protein [Carboxylicivirga marina]